MPIDPSLEQGAFGPEVTSVMGEAFDAACRERHHTGRAEMIREVVARRIIAAARRGELDPVRLRTAALAGLSSPRCRPRLRTEGIISPHAADLSHSRQKSLNRVGARPCRPPARNRA